MSLCCVLGLGLLFLRGLMLGRSETPFLSGSLACSMMACRTSVIKQKVFIGRGRKLAVVVSCTIGRSSVALFLLFLAHPPFPILGARFLLSSTFAWATYPLLPRERTDTHIRKVDSLPIVAGREGSVEGAALPWNHEYAHNR
jgi:hypothetical protein